MRAASTSNGHEPRDAVAHDIVVCVRYSRLPVCGRDEKVAFSVLATCACGAVAWAAVLQILCCVSMCLAVVGSIFRLGQWAGCGARMSSLRRAQLSSG